MTHDDELTHELSSTMHQRVGGVEGHPIAFDAVRSRASGIRRRRRITAAASVAAAVAIIAPAAWMAGSGLNHADDKPDPATPSQETHQVTLRSGMKAGPDPEIAYISDRTLHAPDGTEVPLTKDYTSFLQADDRWIAVLEGGGSNLATVDILDNGGKVLDSFRSQGAPVRSADSTVAGWISPDNELVTWWDDQTTIISNDSGEILIPVAILGTESCQEGEADDAGCRMIYNRSSYTGEAPPPRAANSQGTVEDFGGRFEEVQAVSSTGLAVGYIDPYNSRPSGKRCSAMYDERSNERLYRLCDQEFSYAGFSEDGEHVATQTFGETGTSTGIQLRDSRSGKVLVDAKLGRKAMNGHQIVNATWEDNDHVLVTTNAPDRDSDGMTGYDMFRISLDGEVEQVFDPATESGSIETSWVLGS